MRQIVVVVFAACFGVPMAYGDLMFTFGDLTPSPPIISNGVDPISVSLQILVVSDSSDSVSTLTADVDVSDLTAISNVMVDSGSNSFGFDIFVDNDNVEGFQVEGAELNPTAPIAIPASPAQFGIVTFDIDPTFLGDLVLTFDDVASIGGGPSGPISASGSGSATFTVVPEPASLALLGLGSMLVIGRRRRTLA